MSTTPSPWWYQFIETPNPIDRVAALVALEHPNVDVQIEAFLRVIFNDWDLRFCEEVIIKVGTRHARGGFPYSISSAIRVTASEHGELHRELIYPFLEYLLQFPDMEWDVRRSLEEIEWWLFRQDLPNDSRTTAQLLARAINMEPRPYAWELPPRWPRRRKTAKIHPRRTRRIR